MKYLLIILSLFSLSGCCEKKPKEPMQFNVVDTTVKHYEENSRTYFKLKDGSTIYSYGIHAKNGESGILTVEHGKLLNGRAYYPRFVKNGGEGEFGY